ncbi:target of Nesh-SH3 isoform X5 [Salmo salar]|uniref:Target of Nesh-SH3 isoform X5 n=1 Tax=Salmo salar TaxID=8030 RepID=A0A1S3NXH8_SALSA|nr:target of Nesh-SH3 isoform X5 [Salmo salar]|eukprot:XP_014020108.1 PREDICTED: target of Nesh-SH3-like isoform X6 [Salmo salar]
MQLSHTFLVFLFLLFIVEIALAGSSTARRSRVRRQNMKVRINATGDTIVMKFVRPNADTKLEGYILGYGSSMFSKQFIQLPENGLPYETEIDAEPKYLIAVQPIPVNDVKKQCTGNVNLEKPLHLVIGSVTPTSVLLSWGTFLKTPYEGDIMNDCLEDGNYTVRYRERNRKWTYQTCPASDTVIDSLKPNTAYEFGVRPNNKERSGVWSKPVIHNTNMSGKVMQKPYKPRTPLKPVKTVNMPRAFFPPHHAVHNRSQGRTLYRTPVAPRTTFGSPAVLQPFLPVNKRPNLVGKSGDKDKLMDLKQGDNASILKSFPPVTAKPTKQKTTTLAPALNATGDNSSVFSSLPASEVDAMGKKRFVAPHVIYKTDKKPDEPCSITKSLSFFPEEEGVEQNVTAPPRLPPSNLTVVTVEGCPSFVILDWEKTDNDTTEYEVISRTHGPNGEEVSILTTNQTHTAVENLKPENSYEFKVKPKNELGEGPASEPVLFNTESADPRVSENVSGKDAIWTQFPFKADSYSECNGKQYVKRTWYRKFVGIQLCNSLRYKIYMSDSLTGKFYNIGDQTGHGEDHCQFVDSFLDGQTGSQLLADQLPSRSGFYRAMRQEPVNFGEIGGNSHATYVGWYECGTPIPGKW